MLDQQSEDEISEEARRGRKERLRCQRISESLRVRRFAMAGVREPHTLPTGELVYKTRLGHAENAVFAAEVYEGYLARRAKPKKPKKEKAS